MVNFGYPYNDIVICKDSTDYLICHSLKPKSSLLTCVMAVHSTNHTLTAVIMILKDRNSLYAIRVGGFMIAAHWRLYDSGTILH